MVPAPLSTNQEESQRPAAAVPVLGIWVRGTLVGIALGLILVFTTAAFLNPYTEDGQARLMGTHQLMGLPPCTFYQLSGLPCPSCGMTTSFALLVRGDIMNSLRANAVGTMLAVLCLAIVPWSLASALLKRPLFIVSIERAMLKIVIGFLGLMLLRWFIVLGILLWNGIRS
jgi:Protein of unknown function (DUF2752)